MTTVLITGANRGFGFEMAKILAARQGYRIIACCRRPSEAADLQELSRTHANIDIRALDVADHVQIDSLARALDGTPIDILLNNAGIFGANPPATTGFQDQMFGKSQFETDWLAPYKVNVIGPMKMTEAFVNHVEASSMKKVAILTSVVGSITNAMGHMFGYAASKAAANMTAKNLAVALKDRGIMVNPIHPGYAKTDMSGPQASIEPREGAKGVISRIDEMTLERSGDFLSYDGQSIAW